MIEMRRRGFIAGLGALFAAPAIVRASSLMPVKVLKVEPVKEFVTTTIFNRISIDPDMVALLEIRIRDATDVMRMHMADSIFNDYTMTPGGLSAFLQS